MIIAFLIPDVPVIIAFLIPDATHSLQSTRGVGDTNVVEIEAGVMLLAALDGEGLDDWLGFHT